MAQMLLLIIFIGLLSLVSPFSVKAFANPKQIFDDVPDTSPFFNEINSLYEGKVAYGFLENGQLFYKPQLPVSRYAGTIFLLRAKYGYDENETPINGPFPPTTPYFTDASSPAQQPWIDKFYYDGITTGCNPQLFCPDMPLTRQDAAVFLVRIFNGKNFVPPTPTLANPFSDVSPTDSRYKYIMYLYENGITAGCNPGSFCPNDAITREALARLITRMYGGWSRLVTQKIRNPANLSDPAIYGDAIHVTLLPDSKLLFAGYRRNEINRSQLPDENYFQQMWGSAWVMDPSAWDGSLELTSNLESDATVGMKVVVTPSPGWEPASSTNNKQELFCGGQTLLSDGKVIYVGGNNRSFPRVNGVMDWINRRVDGLNYSKIFNYLSTGLNRWTTAGGTNGTMLGGDRWYPTATLLSDSKILITSGFKTFTPLASQSANFSVELYNPATNTYESLISTPKYICGGNFCDSGNVFALTSGMYPSMFVLPQPITANNATYNILGFGDGGYPVFLRYPFDLTNPSNLASNWMVRNQQRPAMSLIAPFTKSSSLMLPIRLSTGNYSNGSILMVGGSPDPNLGTPVTTSLSTASAPEETHSMDSMHSMTSIGLPPTGTCTLPNGNIPEYLAANVYDPSGNGQWKYNINMGVVRSIASTVILPDSRIFTVNGYGYSHSCVEGIDATAAQTIDPLTTENGSLVVRPGSLHVPESRSYHNNALLLPDGRVYEGGGAPDDGTAFIEQTNFRFYSPAYMFKPRPRITNLETTNFNYGKTYKVDVSKSTVPINAITEAVLISLGSQTHSFDMNQRSIQVQLTPDPTTANRYLVSAPSQRTVAPPGYYMLFVLDQSRIPSEAKIIQLSYLPGDIYPNGNPDGRVDAQDMQFLLQNFYNATCGNVADLNGDCKVNMLDAGLMVKNFTP